MSIASVLALAMCSCGPSSGAAADVTPPTSASSDASTHLPEDAGIAADHAAAAAPDPTIVGPGSDHCEKATVIPLASARSELHADTTGATHDIDAPCTSAGGADVFYRFTVSRRVLVYADTFGATWNTALFLLSSTCAPLAKGMMEGDAVCSDDACGTPQSRLVTLLPPGDYRLGVGGPEVGAATVHFEIVPAASGTESELPAGRSAQSGTTQGESGNVQDGCLAAGPENGYWWTTCPSDRGGTLVASTCGGASWETLLSLEMPRASASMCSSGTCNLQTELRASVPAGAGVHQLVVDGPAANARGPYVMQVDRP